MSPTQVKLFGSMMAIAIGLGTSCGRIEQSRPNTISDTSPMAKTVSLDPTSGRFFSRSLKNTPTGLDWVYEATCTGSGLILDGHRYIVSAAHCFTGTIQGLGGAVRLPAGSVTTRFEFTNCGGAQVSLGTIHRTVADNAFPLGLPNVMALARFGDIALAELSPGETPLEESCFARVAETPLESTGVTLVVHGIRQFTLSPDTGKTIPAYDDKKRVFEKRGVLADSTGLLGSIMTPTGDSGDSGGRSHVEGQPNLTVAVNSYITANPDGTPRCLAVSLVTAPVLRAILSGPDQKYEVNGNTVASSWPGITNIGAKPACSSR